MNQLLDDRHIRSAPCPTCFLCGSHGDYLYEEQKDRLFGAEGLWNLKRCAGDACGLVWLDPMPLPGDIGKAYATYYTHSPNGPEKRDSLPKRLFNLIKLGYLARRFNYQAASRTRMLRNLGLLLYLFPLRRRKVEGDHRFLQAVPEGRLLDVGCGSGEWLTQMRALGWRTEGVDFDEKAVKAAQSRGLNVSMGSIEDQNYPDDCFDAVTLSHVIEHIPEPIRTLAECRRVLKPGGTLVVLTPNAMSLSHRLFKKDWRGLEPPRHLHIFSNRSLPPVLARAGFKNIVLHPHDAPNVFYESIFLRRGFETSTAGHPRDRVVGIMTRLFLMAQFCMLKWDSTAGDCLAAAAIK